MANLAGFDVIVEVHKDTIVDAINLIPVPDPSGAGGIYLLGGPFAVELPVVVPQIGSTTLSLLLEITLEAVVHQPVLRLVVTLRSGSCMLLGKGIDHIGGSLTLDVPLVFQLASGRSVGDPWQIVLQMPAAHFTCQLDSVTKAKVGTVIQPANLSKFCEALNQGIMMLAGRPIPLAMPLLRVVPGVDSWDRLQLSAVPVVGWIDTFTLGVFGYYSASGSGGSVSAKTDSDLQWSDEFLYLPEPEGITPTRQFAFLLSAGAAQRLLLCPVVRDGVVRNLRVEQQYWQFIEEITSSPQQYQAIVDEQNKHYFEYFVDELKNALPTFPGWRGDAETERIMQAHDRAEARVRADVAKAIRDEARDQANFWLASPASSGPAIDAAVPPPCGTGTVEAFRKPIDELTVQSKFVVAMLREFDIVPGDGRLVAHYKVDAFIEDILGDVAFAAEGDIEITLDVTYNGLIYAHLTALTPNVTVDTSGLTGTLTGILRRCSPAPGRRRSHS